jgi:hypothetical protein
MTSIEDKLVIKNTNSTFIIVEDNILHICYDENVEIEVEDIIEIENSFNSLPNPKPLKILQEMGKYSSISPEAREFAAERSPGLKAVAYVVHNLGQRILLRFYIKMWRRKKPGKVFDSCDEALDWLKSI